MNQADSVIQVHACLFDKVVSGFANHLDAIGFSTPFKKINDLLLFAATSDRVQQDGFHLMDM